MGKNKSHKKSISEDSSLKQSKEHSVDKKKGEDFKNVLVGIIISFRFLVNSRTIEGIIIFGGYVLVGLSIISYFHSPELIRYIPSILFVALLLVFFIFYAIIAKKSNFKLWTGSKIFIKSNLLIFALLLIITILLILTLLTIPLTPTLINFIIATYLTILTIAIFRLLQEINNLNSNDFIVYSIKLLDELQKKWDSEHKFNANEKVKLFWSIKLAYKGFKNSANRWMDKEFIKRIQLLSFPKLSTSIAMIERDDKKTLAKIHQILKKLEETYMYENPKKFKSVIENDIKEVASTFGIEDISVDLEEKESITYQLKKYILPIIFIFNAIFAILKLF